MTERVCVCACSLVRGKYVLRTKGMMCCAKSKKYTACTPRDMHIYSIINATIIY